MKPAYEALRNRLEEMTALVRLAEVRAQSGQIINLGFSDKDVERICASVKAIPPESAREIQPYMADLISALDGLAEHLQDFKGRFGQK